MKFMKKIAVFLLTLMVCFSIVPSNVNAESYATPGKTYYDYYNAYEYSTYKIYLKRAQKVNFKITTSGNNCNFNEFKIYDKNGDQIRSEGIGNNNTVGKYTTYYTDYLSRGEYTVYFHAGYNTNNGKLSWSYSGKNMSRVTQRTHNTYSRAPTCGFRKYYFDFLGSENSKNIIKVNVPATGTYEMRVTSTVDKGIRYNIYNSHIDWIAERYDIDVDSTVGKVSDRDNYYLKKGTYYIVFEGKRYWTNRGIYKWMMRRIR